MLLRSDGGALTCGSDEEGQCDLPAPDADLSYGQAAARTLLTGLLGSKDVAVACGVDEGGWCDLPALIADLSYAPAAAMARHTVRFQERLRRRGLRLERGGSV